ncbi:SPOSA6832_03646 [Sporobolomyces salmonicolor]|uniref:Translation initiation factor eIF2B subunit beta n=1 Tax=Sporidiobolus salmonicolor TaxID=5005 RepID=A0A0D6EP92_SPOSA|nr:SPOSA6832_03646 [Sporobolomyces salmonicolor]
MLDRRKEGAKEAQVVTHLDVATVREETAEKEVKHQNKLNVAGAEEQVNDRGQAKAAGLREGSFFAVPPALASVMPSAMLTESVSKPNVHRRIEGLAVKLRRRQLVGSREVALEVIRLIREVVASAKFNSFEQLTAHIDEVGKVLQDAGPKGESSFPLPSCRSLCREARRRVLWRSGRIPLERSDLCELELTGSSSAAELVVTNMARRICMLMREEYATALSNHLESSASPSSAPPTPQIPQTPAVAGVPSESFFTERDIMGRTRAGALGSMFDLLGHKPTPEGVPQVNTGRASTSAWGGPSPGPSSPSTSAPTSPPQSPASSQILQRPSPLSRPMSTADSTHLREEEFSRRSFHLKPVFIEAIQELMDEVEMTYRSVGEQSTDHIHSGEFILTIGHSKTVEAFLKNAARKRKFTVIVAETAPSFSGRATALALSAANIPTILIPDSNIFALLPRCSKVLLGPHLVLADGALLSISGSLPLCMAANRMRVPVVAVGGMFKFSPLYLGEADWGMRDLGSPDEVLKSTEGGMGEGGEDDTEVLNPYYDVVPAELVSLYISNLCVPVSSVRSRWAPAHLLSRNSGGHPSSLLYRLLNDMYGSS